MFKKVSLVFVLCLIIFVLSACSKSGTDTEKDVTTTPTDSSTPTPTVEATPSESADATLTPTESVTPTPTEAITPTAEPTEVPSQPEENVPMAKVLDAYYDFICNGLDIPEEDKVAGMRYGLAFIDNDEIPELLISNNNNHGTGVRVFFYNGGDVKEVGSFGSEGGFSYIKKENKIISFFMGGGAITASLNHVNPDYTVSLDLDYYENDDGTCTINGEPVEYNLMEELWAKAIESAEGNKRLLVDYNTLFP